MANSNKKPCILAAEVYFPKTYVSQEDLETYDKVGAGKYTIGLGQTNMAFAGDREDVVSMSLNAVDSLMTKFQNVYDVEGVDNINACYGGTAALFNAINHLYSPFFSAKKPFCLVVASDIALYAPGPARPTGGAGAVALLVGWNDSALSHFPSARVLIDPIRGNFFDHAWDFYKPDLHTGSEFPVVDGPLSIQCYLHALDRCYSAFWDSRGRGKKEGVKVFDYIIFHSPFSKLVQKSVARLMYNDFVNNPDLAEFETVQQFRGLQPEQTYFNREIETAFVKLSSSVYEQKTVDSQLLSKNLGNSYTACLYTCLLSLLAKPDLKPHASVLCFSYGSGLASSMFSLTLDGEFSEFRNILDLPNRLAARTKLSPEQFTKIVATRSKQLKDNNFEDTIEHVGTGCWYLESIDDKFRRVYKKKE